MRKPIAVILLFAFVSAQYARQVSYLECKLVNYFSQSTVKCDCNQLLGPANDSSSTTQPVIHNHIHLDEWYSPGHSYSPVRPFSRLSQGRPILITSLVTGIDSTPDHPPQQPWRMSLTWHTW